MAPEASIGTGGRRRSAATDILKGIKFRSGLRIHTDHLEQSAGDDSHIAFVVKVDRPGISRIDPVPWDAEPEKTSNCELTGTLSSFNTLRVRDRRLVLSSVTCWRATRSSKREHSSVALCLSCEFTAGPDQ